MNGRQHGLQRQALLTGAGANARINVDGLVEFAQRKTGMNNLGECGDIVLEGWKCLAKAITDTKRYNALGMHRLNQDILGCVEGHLRFEGDLDRYPEIRDVPVV